MEPNFLDQGRNVFMNESKIKIEGERFKRNFKFSIKNDDAM